MLLTTLLIVVNRKYGKTLIKWFILDTVNGCTFSNNKAAEKKFTYEPFYYCQVIFWCIK